MRPHIGKNKQKKIARERINRLFVLAEKTALRHRLDLATRYVTLARKLSMRYLVSIPREFKKRFCKYCYCYLQPGVNSRYRVGHKNIIIYCSECGRYTRIPFYRKTKQKKKKRNQRNKTL